MFFIGFLVGGLVGVFVGIMMIALCNASGKEHDAEDVDNAEDELNRK